MLGVEDNICSVIACLGQAVNLSQVRCFTFSSERLEVLQEKFCLKKFRSSTVSILKA